MAVFLSDEQDTAVDADDLLALARHVLEARDVPPEAELALMLVDRSAIAALNAEHLGAEGPTDVLAFPIDRPGEASEGPPPVLGDVVVCPEVAEEQAAEADHSVQEELQLLTVHGILHVLGMDHARAEPRREMFALTERLLESHRGGDGTRIASS